MPLDPGAIDSAGNFLNNDSMAKYMEDALPPSPDPEDSGRAGRREFLIAISTGVINYLKQHDRDSFRVILDPTIDPQGNYDGTIDIL
jgi:hypothetical protein